MSIWPPTTTNAERRDNPALARAARAVLLALLLLAPLAFGAVEPWAWGAIGVAAALALLLWSAACLAQKSVTLAWSPVDIPVLLFWLFVVLQRFGGLSLDNANSSEALLKLSIALVVFFLMRQLYSGASRDTWNTLGTLLLAYTSLLAVGAILQFFAAPGSIYGALISPSGSFGPYVDRDHFAGLFEMLLPLAACYFIATWRHSRLALLWGFGLVVAVAALLFTGSRGGLLALLGETLLLMVLISVETRGPRRAMLVSAVSVLLLAAVAFLLFFAPPELTAKLGSVMHFTDTVVMGERPKVARDSLRMFAAHPVTGSGLGTFEVVYPQFQSFASDKSWPYAHNDYAQLLAETGVIGGALALAALLLFLLCTLRARDPRESAISSWMQVGATVGCCGLLIHSFFDFNLHIPANAAWFAACAGLATLPRQK